LPDIVVGEYIKINLIGKPKAQSMDMQYYIALRYVGFKGIKIDEMKDLNLRNILESSILP